MIKISHRILPNCTWIKSCQDRKISWGISNRYCMPLKIFMSSILYIGISNQRIYWLIMTYSRLLILGWVGSCFRGISSFIKSIMGLLWRHRRRYDLSRGIRINVIYIRWELHCIGWYIENSHIKINSAKNSS